MVELTMETERRLTGRRGVTIIEAVIAAGLLSLVLVVTLSLLANMLGLWSKGASGTSANSHASLAMRKLVLDIEEGKSAQVNGSQLVVSFPYYDASAGMYMKALPGDTATYYLSGETGDEPTGDYLWKVVGSTKTRLAKNVESLSFVVTNARLVRINLTGRDVEGGAISPNLVQQSVKLRNS